MRPGERFVSLGSATLAPSSSADLTRVFAPEATPPSSSDPAPQTFVARPSDGAPDGDKLSLMNDLLGALPGGATTTLWFDERPPEVRYHDPATPSDDLVNLAGHPPASTPALAVVLAAAMKQE